MIIATIVFLYCRVMKLAAMPSCLGGGESRDKHSVFGVDHQRAQSALRLTAS